MCCELVFLVIGRLTETVENWTVANRGPTRERARARAGAGAGAAAGIPARHDSSGKIR